MCVALQVCRGEDPVGRPGGGEEAEGVQGHPQQADTRQLREAAAAGAAQANEVDALHVNTLRRQ